MTKDNKLLGKFYLEDIPAAPKGIPQIEITVDIDANGILIVSAQEKATGKNSRINIREQGISSLDIVDKLFNEIKPVEIKFPN